MKEICTEWAIHAGQPATSQLWQRILALQVVVHVMGSFQVYAMPVFDMMETLLVKNGFSNALPYRLLVRSAYVIAVGFFAITLPFFGSLLGFLGALP